MSNVRNLDLFGTFGMFEFHKIYRIYIFCLDTVFCIILSDYGFTVDLCVHFLPGVYFSPNIQAICVSPPQHLHKQHHTFKIPTPFASHAFHPLDGFLQSLPYHVYPFIFPLHKVLAHFPLCTKHFNVRSEDKQYVK